MFSEADLDAILADDGVTVVVGAESATGIFSSMDVIEDDGLGVGQIAAHHPTVLVKASVLTGAARHGACTVAGTPYTIRDIRTESHDQLKRFYLVATTA